MRFMLQFNQTELFLGCRAPKQGPLPGESSNKTKQKIKEKNMDIYEEKNFNYIKLRAAETII